MKRNVCTFTPSLHSKPCFKETPPLRFARQLLQRLLGVSGSKQFAIWLVAVFWGAGIAAAQVTSPTQDVLGAHNVYGRGCVACHTPHNRVPGSGARSVKNSGRSPLWGQDLTPLYSTSLSSVAHPPAGYGVTLPETHREGVPSGYGDGYNDLLACLSCHDGNLATSDMMKGTTVETVSIAGTTFNPPTLVGNDESRAGSYTNGHPVGPEATISCGGKKGWDCAIGGDGSVTFTGPKGRAFIADYFDVTAGDGPLNHLVKVPGSTTNGAMIASKSWITCTTCHDEHDMPYFSTSNGAVKPTHFFVRGWYNPGSSASSNSAAQFCRSCHADKSNEAKGRMVPTT